MIAVLLRNLSSALHIDLQALPCVGYYLWKCIDTSKIALLRNTFPHARKYPPRRPMPRLL